jgi:hypothetical protein
MTDSKPRYVTVRRTHAGNWCIEADHPGVPVPQVHALEGVAFRPSYRTLAALREALSAAGYSIQESAGQRHVTRRGDFVAA